MLASFSYFYTIVYTLILLNFLSITVVLTPINFISKYSIKNYLNYINKYTINFNIFYFNVLILTGLPPVSLFFLKFNILNILISKLSSFFIFFIFLFFLLNIFFYTQLLTFKNYKNKILNVFKSDIFCSYNSYYYRSFIISKYNKFYYVSYMVNFVFLMLLFVLFYSDFIITINCQQ